LKVINVHVTSSTFVPLPRHRLFLFFMKCEREHNLKKTYFFTFSAEFCEKIDSENCPHSLKVKRESNFGQVDGEWKSADEYLKIILNEIFERMDLIISLALTSLTVLIFTLGYYCISKARKEGPLIAKVRNLFSAQKAQRPEVSGLFNTDDNSDLYQNNNKFRIGLREKVHLHNCSLKGFARTLFRF
jgi:hypothetical protein